MLLLLLQNCFCFVMRETSCCLCQKIIKLILLKLLTPSPDIKMTSLILMPSPVAKSVTCLATDARVTADPGFSQLDPGLVPYFHGD